MSQQTDEARDDAIDRTHQWWSALTQARYPDGRPRRIDTGAVARLRRAGTLIDILFEPAAVELIRQVGHADNEFHQEVIARLAAVLAHVRTDAPGVRFAASLGGREVDQRKLSATRFRRLLQADSLDERMTAIRRAIQMLDGRANVRDLARSWIRLSYPSSRERTKALWMVAYVGGLDPDATRGAPGETANTGQSVREPD